MKKPIFLVIFLTISLLSFSQYNTEFNWDTITFEESYPYLQIDTSFDNIWQIGTPNKVFFNSAFSDDKAIVTDTINSYPINNNSFFEIKIGSFNYNNYYPYDIFMEIIHKYDTDTLKDGGFISVSYDNGLNWMNIIKDSIYWEITPAFANGNLYTENNTLYNGELGFSGNSGGWVSTWFSWYQLPVKSINEISDTTIIRFSFISDSIQTNKDGWMIDNIRLYSVDLGGNIESNEDFDFQIYPNPMNNNTTIEFKAHYDNLELEILNLQGKLIKHQTFYDSKSIILEKSDLKTGFYILKVKTTNNLIGVRKLFIK